MPAPLGPQPYKPSSEPNVPRAPAHLAAMYAGDRAALHTQRLPPAQSAYPAPRIQNLYVPPGMAAQLFPGDMERLEASRHSALGLENLGYGGISNKTLPLSGQDHSRIRAPTVGSPRGCNADCLIMVQPPSSRSPNMSALSAPRTPRRGREPYEIPLPEPRSHAPTAYAQTPRTMLLSPPDEDSRRERVNIIDYATRRPLPVSRPTTYHAEQSPGTALRMVSVEVG